MSFDLTESFSFNMNDLPFNKEVKRDSKLYTPNLEKAPDGEYKAMLRFVPNLKKPSDSLLIKEQYKITNPRTGKKMIVDDPKTLGKEHRSPLVDAFFALHSMGPDGQKMARAHFEWFKSAFSYVQIIQDPQSPELNGQLKIWRFGQTILNKFPNTNKKDTPSEFDEFVEEIKPYDLVEGNVFLLNVKKLSKYPNYDDAQFLPKKAPLMINGEYIANDPKWREPLMAWFEANAESMEEFEFRPWSDETKAIVAEAIQVAIPQTQLVEKILGSHNLLDYLPGRVQTTVIGQQAGGSVPATGYSPAPVSPAPVSPGPTNTALELDPNDVLNMKVENYEDDGLTLDTSDDASVDTFDLGSFLDD